MTDDSHPHDADSQAADSQAAGPQAAGPQAAGQQTDSQQAAGPEEPGPHETNQPATDPGDAAASGQPGGAPTEDPARLTARVAKVLDDRNLVINRGRQQGVANGQRFVIFTPGEEVTDPVTGASLGTLELVKGHARVIHVQEKLAILRLERPGEGRTKTLSEMMATLSGRDETKLPEVVVGDCARPADEETTSDVMDASHL